MHDDDPNAATLHAYPREDEDDARTEPEAPTDAFVASEAELDPGPPPLQPSQRVTAFLKRAGAITREQTSKAARQVAKHGAPIARDAAGRVGNLGVLARDNVRARLAPIDDTEAFARAVTPLVDPHATTATLPVTAVTGVAIAAASVGAFGNATDLMRFTRPLMDADSAGLQRWLAEVFPAATNPAVSRAMDTMPGADYAGGMFHRLHHGHDVAGLVEMVRSFGFEGAASWFNHVGLRDLWTPHGVPWLPVGAGDVHTWLVDLGMQKTLAATLLSVNAATLAGTALGLLALGTFRRAIRASLDRAEARGRFDHALAARDAGDPVTATGRFEAAMRLPGMTTHLRLAAAISALEAARNSDDDETRRRVAKDASYWLRDYLADDGGKTLHRGSAPMWAGADVSTPGVAAALYGQAIMLAYGDDATASLEIDRMRTGVAAAIEHADRLLDPPRLGPLARPPRPLSAAVNHTIALESVLAYPNRLVTANTEPAALKRRVRESLLSTAGTEHEAFARVALDRLDQRFPERALVPA